MYDESWELESLRRSLVMCAPEGPATSLTNRDASQLISRVQAMEEELEMLRSGVAVALAPTPHRSPAPTHSCDASALIWGRLLVASRPAESYDEGPGAPKSW